MADLETVRRALRDKKSGNLKFSELPSNLQSALKAHARTSNGSDDLTKQVKHAIADEKY